MYDYIKNEKLFRYFEELSKIPHGSGNMEAISEYCMDFARAHSLSAYKDEACNVIICKPASKGYEDREPVILQGHLDMVCQKEEDSDIDFERDGLSLYRDGDYLKARGTTLGGDDAIAIAMIMAMLDDDSLKHPPIEAVFTTDEEIGMVGALRLDLKKLSGKRMINIDSEDAKTVTVSCAGGSDFAVRLPFKRVIKRGEKVKISIKGLKGGHSGVEIDKNRVNADILMGELLSRLDNSSELEIIGINGGDKGNAIVTGCECSLMVAAKDSFDRVLQGVLGEALEKIKATEPEAVIEAEYEGECSCEVIEPEVGRRLIYILDNVPNGVVEMSKEIEGLVETSLNLGIVKTNSDALELLFTLRSNKKSKLITLLEELREFFSSVECEITTSGQYPPWEYKADSRLRELYLECYSSALGEYPSVEAIHAGLECGVFASGIEGLDCISIGPELLDIHTTKERLSIRSTEQVYAIIVEMLEKL